MYEDLQSLYSKSKEYFIPYYNFLISYKNDLENLFYNNYDKDDLLRVDDDIINQKIEMIFKLFKKKNITEEVILQSYDLYNEIGYIIEKNTILLDSIDIYSYKSLLSDSIKKNIYKNKLQLSELYKIIKEKNNILNDNIINESINILTKIDIFDLFKYIKKYKNCINIIIQLIYKTENESFREILIENFKIIILKSKNKELLIKLQDSKRLKNKEQNINKLISFRKYRFDKSYDSLQNLLKDNLSLSIDITITNSFNKINIENIYKISQEYKKQYNEEICIVIIVSKKENFIYTVDNLLNKKLEATSLFANNKLLEKTKTIQADINCKYISANNAKQCYLINYIDINNLSLVDYESKVLLINYYDKYFNVYKNNNFSFLKIKDVKYIINNHPNYNIEAYNNEIESSIMKNINNINIVDKYIKTISLDLEKHNKIDINILYSNIINDIKKLNVIIPNDKNKSVDNILNIIKDNIFSLLRQNINIKFNEELKLTFTSGVNDIIKKLKKDIIDKYEEKDIFNLLKILLKTIEKKILKLNNSLLDKKYYLEFNN